MTYLLINYEYPPLGGGAATASKNLGEALTRRGNRVVVLTSAYKHLHGVADEDRITVIRVPAWRVIEGWITNGRGFNDAFIRPIDVYCGPGLLNGQRRIALERVPTTFSNAERRTPNAKRTSPISLRCRIEPQELSSAGF